VTERLDGIAERLSKFEGKMIVLEERLDIATLQRTELLGIINDINNKLDKLITAYHISMGARTALKLVAWAAGGLVAAGASLTAIWGHLSPPR
jgi:hypothetical protein